MLTHLAVALAALLMLWLALVALVWWSGRAVSTRAPLGEAMRLLPDVLRLLHRLARDRSVPRGVRLRLLVVLGYLAIPLDLIPDLVPVIGYADDVVVVAYGLRAVARAAGPDALARHWPGSASGLRLVLRLAGLPSGSG